MAGECGDRTEAAERIREAVGAMRSPILLPKWLATRLACAFAALGAEAVADLGDDFDQQVDFGRRVVEVEAGPGAGGDAEPVVERLGAVVAGADGDALLVEQLGDVVGVGFGRA